MNFFKISLLVFAFLLIPLCATAETQITFNTHYVLAIPVDGADLFYEEVNLDSGQVTTKVIHFSENDGEVQTKTIPTETNKFIRIRSLTFPMDRSYTWSGTLGNCDDYMQAILNHKENIHFFLNFYLPGSPDGWANLGCHVE